MLPSGPPPLPPAAPAGRKFPSWLGPVVSIAVVLGLLVVAVVLVARGPKSKWAKEWDPRVVDMVRFVESDRGLQFKQPVKVLFMSKPDFLKWVQDSSSFSGGATGDEYIVEETLGLVPAGFDPAVGESGQEASILGAYTYGEKVIRINGTELTPETRLTVVHELTHALQDQIFDLDSLGRDFETDQQYEGLTAVIEGDAVLVEENYYSTFSDADRAALEKESEAFGEDEAIQELPVGLQYYSSLPYIVGDEFIFLMSLESDSARDDLFTESPMSDLVLIDPLAHVSPPEVEAIAPDEEAAIANVPDEIGGARWYLSFLSAMAPEEARTTIGAFGADRVAFTRSGGRACVIANLAPRTAASYGTLVEGLDVWAASEGFDRTVKGNGETVDVTACGGEVSIDPDEFSDRFTHVVARNFLMGSLRLEEVVDSVEQAQCVADNSLASVPADELFAMQDPDDLAELVDAATTCPV